MPDQTNMRRILLNTSPQDGTELRKLCLRSGMCFRNSQNFACLIYERFKAIQHCQFVTSLYFISFWLIGTSQSMSGQ